MQRSALPAALMLSVLTLPAGQASAQSVSPATIEGTVGVQDGNAAAMFDLFMPLYGDGGQLFFADARATFGGSDEVQQGSFGFGYRTRTSTDWVLGINAYADYLHSDYDNDFLQLGFGLEALSQDWEVRANAYAPIGDLKQTVASLNAALIEYERLVFRAGEETAMRGFDAEIGYRVPVFTADDLTQLKVYGGGYWYQGDGFEDVPGVSARVELSRAALPAFGNGSRFTLIAGVTYDDQREAQGTLLARLRVPLGDTSAQAPYDPLYRRVDRADEIRTHAGATGRAETAIYVETGQAAGRVVRLGETDDAASANAALMAGADGALVLASGDIELDDTLQLGNGQYLLGGGGSVVVRGASSGGLAAFRSFAPGATFTGTNALADVISMGNGSAVAALDVRGGYNGIAADGVDGIVLRDLDIAQTGNHGISLYDVAGARISQTDIHDLTVCPPPGNPECSYTIFEPDAAHFAGISAVGVRDLTLSDVSIANTTFGLFIANDYEEIDWSQTTVIQSENVRVDNVAITNTVREGLMLVGVQNAELRNLVIDNSTSTSDELDVLVLHEVRDVLFDGLTVRGGVNGFMFAPPMIEGNITTNVHIANAVIEGGAWRGFYLNPVHDVSFENVVVRDTGDAFVFSGDAWGFMGGPIQGVDFTNVSVENVDTAVTVYGPIENFNGDIALANVGTACSSWGGTLDQTDGSVFSVGGVVATPPSPCP